MVAGARETEPFVSDLRTVYLGQFEHARAERIAAMLEEEGIAWTYKQFGRLTRMFFAGDWGVRLYVDASRTEDVRSIMARLDQESAP